MVPKEWERKPIKELCESIIDCVNKTAKHVDYITPYKMIRTTNVRHGKVDTENVRYVDEDVYQQWIRRGAPQDGDIIFTREAPVGEAGILENSEGIFLGQRTMMYRVNPKVANNRFVFYSLMSGYCQKQIEDLSNGGTVAHMRVPDCGEIIINSPPLPEQQKIAKILSTWDKAISTTERLIENSTQQKKALMQQLLTGKKRFGYKDITYSFQKTRYGDIPLDWEYPAIKDISVQLSKKNTDDKDYPVVSCSKHYGFVDSLDYFKKKVYSDDTSGYRIIPRNAFGFPSNHIEEGSIGVQTVHDIAIASPIYVVFKADPKLINNVYLYALLKTEHYRQIFCAATNASVDRRGSLRWKEFSAIRVPLPPLKEQQKIAAVLTNANKEIELLKQQLADLQQEKKALMQVLLTGKKRVLVDGEVA